MKKSIFFLILSARMLFACKQISETKTDEQNDTKPAIDSHNKAYVLHEREGEALLDGQGRTTYLKVSPETGGVHLSAGMTHMPKGSGTLIHRHDHTEEILFAHHGKGLAIINGDTVKITKGTTLFIPPGTWHGIENPDDSMSILYVTTPPGLEKLFRAIGSPPGMPLKKWTGQQMDSIEKESDSKAKKNNK